MSVCVELKESAFFIISMSKNVKQTILNKLFFLLSLIKFNKKRENKIKLSRI